MAQIKHTHIHSLTRGQDQPYRNNTHPNLHPLAGDNGRLAASDLGNWEVQVYRGMGVSRRVWRTTWERSPKNWELQIPCFEEFFWGGTHWDSSLLVSLTLWDTLVLLRPHFPSPKNRAVQIPVVWSLLTLAGSLTLLPKPSRPSTHAKTRKTRTYIRRALVAHHGATSEPTQVGTLAHCHFGASVAESALLQERPSEGRSKDSGVWRRGEIGKG